MDELPPLFAPGQRLGRFELVQRLAVGGMAEVYLAYAAGRGGFRKVVAIKRLLPQHVLDPQLLRMFLDEARLMAQLSHPNVPQVTEVDDGAGVEVPYFVMEYVHGTDLRGILNAAVGALPIEPALTIASAVAAGLHHAHEHRGTGGQPLEIVHRDVSPSNVLISFDGGVKVTDFGVAKWTEQKSFTHQGQLKGKFAHMSPEQCRGEALDRRSDVFALGTLLFEMTTGSPPFVAESDYDLLTQIISRDAPAPSWPDGKYPADLAAIVTRSLRRSRDDRYPSTQDLQLELEAFARRHTLVVSPLALAQYLETLFGARVTEWRQALRSGQTLADHLERRPANPGSPAGPSAKDRTATDTFAAAARASGADDSRAHSQSTVGGASAGAATARAPDRTTSSTSSKVTAGARRGISAPAGVARALAVTLGAALAVTVVLVATELTSRWQRTSRAGFSPMGTAEAISPSPSPSSSSSPSPRPAPPRPSELAPSSRSGEPAGQPSRGRATEETPSATTLSRRAHDTGVAARQGRRGSPSPSSTTALNAPAEAATSQTSPGDSPVAPPPTPLAEPTASPSAPSSTSGPPGTERPVTPPPAPVKVWDPDSPLPP